MARRGIKTSKVSLTKHRRKTIRKKLVPLLHRRVISGYNLTQKHGMKPRNKYKILYGQEVREGHLDRIIDELERRKLNYYVVGRESKFLDRKAFVKSPKQLREGDIVSDDDEYEIIIDANKDKLQSMVAWLKIKGTKFKGTKSLKGAWTTPDIRIRNKKRLREFKLVSEIRKKLDPDTDLVILSVRDKNTDVLRQALKGERQGKVLIQDFKPKKHSLYDFIRKSTKIQKVGRTL